MRIETSSAPHPTTIHVVQRMAPGGLESLALDLLNFSSHPEHTLIISLEGTKNEAIKHWPKLEQYRDQLIFLNKKPGVQLSTLFQLKNMFNELRPQVVHTHHIGPLVYGGIAAKFADIKTRIHTEHDCWHLNNPKHVRLQKWALALAKPTLVADAYQVFNLLNEQFQYPKLTTIKNGIDCKKFIPGLREEARIRYNLPLSRPIIGCAGRLEKVKGHDLMIKALANMPQPIMLVIAGMGSEYDNLIRLTEQLGVANRVRFLGLVSDMPSFYHSLDLFCLPSRSEGFPLAPLEAQACGIPSAVTDVGASSETLCPLTGVLIPPRSPSLMAPILEEAIGKVHTVSPRDFVLNNNEIRQMVKAYEAIAAEDAA
ncbi:glycosyltransferase [Vibrio sp. NTOU-M3]|uniref:glycosyltransferase n=1 Tax=Vibrio sp. NTOU-M3 TaxID=3234954 RepID=UPI00349F6D84